MKKSNRKVDIIIVIVIVLLIIAAVLASLIPKSDGKGAVLEKDVSELTIADLADKNIGVVTGSLFETFVKDNYPEAAISFYNSVPDLTMALKSGKIDSFLLGIESAVALEPEEPTITHIEEDAGSFDCGVVFPKTEAGDKLRAQMDEFITRIEKSGELEELMAFWQGSSGKTSYVDMSGLTGENGTLRFATSGDEMPGSFLVEGKPAGSDPDIAVRFCREYGYDIDITISDFSGIIPGLVSGIYDFAANEVVITEERKQSVNFSVPYLSGPVVMMVRMGSSEENEQNIFASIAESFEKNFIREDRWKLILDGIVTTMIITVAAVILGSILAFGICMFRRTGSTLAIAISNIYVKLLQGTPMVVLLMILYYVILGKSGLEEVWVAIIGFALNFGAYASEIMRSGIESINGGQREAALALGYNENQAFFKFIFPQAAERFMPVYNQEIVSLLKNTSIVGYIAIQDLTKMSDIIRSRTYEAFFPLIATAVIYFILAWIITLILKFAAGRITPKKGR